VRFAHLLLVGGLAIACANDAIAPKVDVVDARKCKAAGYTVTVSPHTATVVVDNTTQLTATVTACGRNVQNVKMTWTSRNTAVVGPIVDDSVIVEAPGIAPGTAYAVATSDGGGKDSSLVTVTGSVACTPTATNMCPGDDVNAKVQAQPSGTAFTFGSGTFIQQSIVPKANDTFTGVHNATILTGARDLSKSTWTNNGSGQFYVTGQTQQNTVFNSYVCQAGHPGCYYPEQLWVNNHLYEHMTTLGAIGTAKWYFDYAADRIYLPFNPSPDSTVETSVSVCAFAGNNASGVTIKHVIVRRYASSAQVATVGCAVPAGSTAPAWIADSIRVHENHGIGIRFTGNGWQVKHSRVDHNGEMGMSGTGQNGLAYGNRIDTNAVAYFGAGASEECSGAKFVSTTGGTIIRRDTVEGNWCNGLWFDTNNRFGTMDSNVVIGNYWSGIIDEVGYNSKICDNTVTNNGADPQGSAGATGTSPAGIIIANSRDAEVCRNVLSGNTHGITGYDSERAAPPIPNGFGTHDVCNMNVHNNTVTQTNANRAAGVADNDPAADPYNCSNLWDFNTYFLGVSTRFRWTGNTNLTWVQWIAANQDTHSSETGQ
jgi:hypothetical protein